METKTENNTGATQDCVPPSRYKRALMWALYNIGALVVAWFALAEKAEWAQNILSFLTAVCSVIALGVFSSDLRALAQKRGREVPTWLAASSDMAIMFGCAATGSFWLATGWLWIMLSEQVLYGAPPR